MPRALQTRLRQSVVLLAMIVLTLAVTVPTGVTATADVIQNESSAENVTLYRASDVTFNDAAAVEAAISDGTVESADKMLIGETLVVQIESERLANDLAARDNATTTARFFAALDDDAALPIVYPDPGPSLAPLLFQLSPDDTTAYRAGTTTYVLIDTGAVDVKWEDKGTRTPEAKLTSNDRFSVTFGYNLKRTAVGGPAIGFHRTEATFVGSNWEYNSLPPIVVNQLVEVNVEPEESLVARLRTEDKQTITAPVKPVDWDVHQALSLDLRNVEPGQNYTLELVHDGTVVDQYNGTVRESSTENITLYRASNTSLDDADAVESAIEDDSIERTDEVVIGETLVVEIESEALAGDLDARDGSPSSRFFTALEDNAMLEIVQTNPNPSRPRKAIQLSPDDTTVHRAGTTTYLLIETDKVEVRSWYEDDDWNPEFRRNDAFAVTFGYDSDTSATSGPEIVFNTPTPTEQTQTTNSNDQDTPGFTATMAAIAVALLLVGGGRRS